MTKPSNQNDMFTALLSFSNSPFWIMLTFNIVLTFQKYGAGHNSNSNASGCGDGCQMASKLLWLLYHSFGSILSCVQNGRQDNVTWLTVSWLQNLNCPPSSGCSSWTDAVQLQLPMSEHLLINAATPLTQLSCEWVNFHFTMNCCEEGGDCYWINTSAMGSILLILSSKFSI